MKLSEIAIRTNCQLEGDGELEITGVTGLEQAGPSELSFLSNPKYALKLKHSRAGAVVLAPNVAVPRPTLAVLRSPNPYLAFAQALELFYQPPRPAPGIHPWASIAPGARLGKNASIGSFAFIDDDVEIGDNAVLHSHVAVYRGARIGDDFYAHSHAVVREYCRIGNRVILQNGAVIGADGYGFAHRTDGSHYKIVQAGIVVLEDDVEVQAHSCIDRATVGETRIKAGAKIDNLVQVGHACTVGENNLICAQVGLAGSTELGRNVLFAGQAASAGHLKVGDGVVVTAMAAPHRDVEPGKMISGAPAIDNKLWLRCVAVYNRLPELVQTVRELKAEIEKLKKGVRSQESGAGSQDPSG
jgi:UDP-3-O-[3-hydroxymyristoyl] glucosamine N-acyltransferase